MHNTIFYISNHPKNYQDEVFVLIDKFDAFNISSNSHSQNSKKYVLANVASKLITFEYIFANLFLVELIYKPSVLDNITNWWVLDDDDQLINFLHIEDTSKDSVIEKAHDDQPLKDQS